MPLFLLNWDAKMTFKYFHIVPHQGVGPIRLGMTKKVVQASNSCLDFLFTSMTKVALNL